MSEFHAALCGAFYLLFFIRSCWTYPLGVSTFHLSSNKRSSIMTFDAFYLTDLNEKMEILAAAYDLL